MKKILIFLLCSVLIVTGFVLAGCDDAEPPSEADAITDNAITDDTEPLAPTSIVIAEGGESPYKVIRVDGSGEKLAELSKELCIYLSELSGARIRVASDLVGRSIDPDTVSEYEILIGNTNRTADDASLDDAGNDGWCVTVSGNKIIINGHSNYAIKDAIEYFKSTLKTEDGKMSFDIASSKVEYRDYDLAGVSLRVGSYNIKFGALVDLDFSVIAADVKALDLDIVGFQEVDNKTSRVGGIDTPAKIAEALGYEYYYFTKALDYKGGGYGTLIVSRYPIDDTESFAFPVHEGYEKRAMGHVVINVNGARVHFFNTHLSYESNELIVEQFGILGEKLSGVRGFILTGDFNTSDTSLFSSIEGHKLVNPQKYVTFPLYSSSIDNIVLESGWKIIASGIGPVGHSDHNMLWAEIKYGE